MIPISLKFRLVAHKDSGLKAAPRILERELTGGLRAVGKTLITAAQSRMRKDTGESQKSLVMRIQGRGLKLSLEVYSQLIQAFVDAYGLHRGVFPAFGVNSRLYKWAARRARGIESQIVQRGKTPAGPSKPKHLRAGRPIKVVRNARRVRRINKTTDTLNAVQRTRAKNNQARRLAFLIARAIFREGLKGSQWNKKALEANKRNIMSQMQNALYRAANAINRA